MSDLVKQIRTEIDAYRDGRVQITESYSFSMHELVRRIYNLANQIYPSGNVDSQGNYKYWFNVIEPRINDETKNIDFDTKDIKLQSEMTNDRFRIFLANARLKEWMRENEQGVKLNEDIEECTGWGNRLWKKTKGGFTNLDFIDTYIINQKARTVNETPIIERHELTNAQLRAKRGVYHEEALQSVLESHGGKSYLDDAANERVSVEDVPVYEVFERNGEVCLKDLNDAREAMGLKVKRTKDEEDTYVLAKVVVSLAKGAGSDSNDAPILYAEEIDSMEDVYKEYHRGRYNGRWFRVGFYELLMDIQIRANAIGNEIARALEFGGKQIYTTSDSTLFKNVLTDMVRGDIIQAKDMKRLDMTLPEMSHYILEWNLLMQNADKLTGSNDITQGAEQPSGTPFRLVGLLNQNANKMYTFVREKLALTFNSIYDDWVVPEFLKDLSSKDVIRLTGDNAYLEEYKKMLVDQWYAANLLNFGPHSEEEAQLIKQAKLEKMDKSTEEMVSVEKGYWKDFKARARIDITGEALDITSDIQNASNLLALEADPGRRNFLLDLVWGKLGIDVTRLPKPAPIEGPLQTGAPPGGSAPPKSGLAPQAI